MLKTDLPTGGGRTLLARAFEGAARDIVERPRGGTSPGVADFDCDLEDTRRGVGWAAARTSGAGAIDLAFEGALDLALDCALDFPSRWIVGGS